MRLLSQTSRKYKETEYKKFWVIVPNDLIEKLGWKTGDELGAKAEKNKLVIEKA